MAYNLARNSKVFVTTNLSTASGQAVAAGGNSNGAGEVLASGFSTTNCFEIQVMDGYKFAQATNATNVQIKEAGTTPIRGQRAFNTALNPVDITFSTYIRPRLASNVATAEERILWNALLGSVGIVGTVQNAATVAGITVAGATSTGSLIRASTATCAATLSWPTSITATGLAVNDIVNVTGLIGASAIYWNAPVKITAINAADITFDYLTALAPAAGTTQSTTISTGAVIFTRSAWQQYPTLGATASYAVCSSANSNKNQLQALGFIFVVDGTAYTIDNCAMDQAQIDFGLDAIAMAAWTAKGTKLNQLSSISVDVTDPALPVLGGSLSGTATGKVTTANYITNKLSTVTLTSNLGGYNSGTAYSVVLTGGSITIANGITYVTPNNLGTLNIPIGYFTGTRSISGTMNAYLRTGTNTTATLLTDILASSATDTDTQYKLQFEIGGATASTRVELEMPGAMIGIPSVDIADVVATTITFNAQSTDKNIQSATATYDIENTNDLTVRYYSV